VLLQGISKLTSVQDIYPSILCFVPVATVTIEHKNFVTIQLYQIHCSHFRYEKTKQKKHEKQQHQNMLIKDKNNGVLERNSVKTFIR
jgi:hypothetical protein